MSRRVRILRNIGIGLAGLIVLLILAVVIVVHTGWFRNFVRQEIITQTQDATGGRVEVGSFDLDLSHLRAVVTNFVIHGKEPASAAPFVRVARLEVDIRLFAGKLFSISYLGIQKPEANIIQFPDGTTNVPTPKVQKESNNSTLKTVVDLAVGHFDLSNGLFSFEAQKQPLNIRGTNLIAQLYYNITQKGYEGRISLNPLYVTQGRDTPVNFRITAPVTLVEDRIDVHNATIATAVSSISIDASVENMKSPRLSAKVNGHLAMIDVQNLTGAPLAINARNVPGEIDLSANALVANDTITVSGLRVGLGQSNIEASGVLKDPRGNGALALKASLDLGQLGRLAKVAQRPDGSVLLNARAKLDQANNYAVTGNIEARNVSFSQGAQRIQGVSLYSAVSVDPHNIALNGLRLNAFGGQFNGNIALADFSRYKVQGRLSNFDIRTLSNVAGQKLPYDGILSGSVDASGDAKAPGARSVIAKANLVIAPGRNGIPVSGRINANYSGASNNVTVLNSYLALPHTRLTLNGSVGQRLNLDLTSHNLDDLLAAVPTTGPPPVALAPNGVLTFHGAVTGGLSNPRVGGHLAADTFSLEGRPFNSLGLDVAATQSGASVQNGSLTRGNMQATFNASVGLRKWSTTPRSPLAVNAAIGSGDLADVMAIAGQSPAGYSGPLTANVKIGGTISDPVGGATLDVGRGTIVKEPFDRIHAQVDLSSGLVAIPVAYIASGPARVDLTAEFHHPRESFSRGDIHAHVQSRGVDLAKFQTVQNQVRAAGALQLNADVNGSLLPTRVAGKEQTSFVLNNINADATGSGLRLNGDPYGDLNLTARTQGRNVAYNLSLSNAGSGLRVSGNTALAADYPTTAQANISDFPVERLLNLASRRDIPVRGTLSGEANVSGTINNPQATANILLTRANIYQEQLDAVRLRASYDPQSVNIQQLQVVRGPERIDLTAHYNHPAGNLQQGSATFSLTSTPINLATIHNIQQMRRGLGGTLDIQASGAATILPATSQPNTQRVLVSSLKANVAATGIAANGKNFGDLRLLANSPAANRVNFALDSNLAGASIHGSGNAELTGKYPVDAKLAFNNVAWTRIQDLLGRSTAEPPAFEVSTDGSLSVNGPVLDPNQLNGAFTLSKLNFTTIPHIGAATPVAISNQGPVSIVMDHGAVRVESAHLTGPNTDIQLTGTASLPAKTMNATLASNVDLGIFRNFNHDLFASGKIVLNAVVRGTFSKPLVNGQLALQNVAASYASFPAGISNGNGTIIFNGNNAQIQNVTAEAGGGKVTLSGFAGYSDVVRFGIHGAASDVRLRVQEGVSITVSADVSLNGTQQNSIATGTATLVQLSYSPQSDIGSMLTRAAPPVQTPTAPSPFLDNMKLDIRIRSSPGMAVQASLAQNLQVAADLRVRGTAATPGITGRVNIYEGQLVFFGATYTVDRGSVSFYNPIRIEPVLDISLETTAQGVHVVLHVTGPIEDMHLSYTSDPPLQFQEIVALLAAGSTPTSDATVLAQKPTQPQQSFQQRGESALLGQAVANPVANRLQRVFGITQLKIDPSFVSGSTIPTARLTLQQRITQNLTFTYVEDLSDPNATIVKVEWAFSQRWSAVAQRDQNGIFSIVGFYKRRFR